uniref:hypothetical protein n=1 Tax=Salmonella sp. SAL04284 TaxID=3159862 RepID=UPI003979C143
SQVRVATVVAIAVGLTDGKGTQAVADAVFARVDPATMIIRCVNVLNAKLVRTSHLSIHRR